MPIAAEPEKLSDFFSGQVRKARRFSMEDVCLPDTPLAVVGGGHEFCSPDYAIQREHFPYYSVELVARGRGWLNLEGKAHVLDAGTIFTYGPAVSQHITTSPRDLLEKYFIDFTGPRAPRIMRECGLTPGTVARVSSVSEVQDIFDTLIRDGMRGGDESGMLCTTLCEYLLIKLAARLIPIGSPPSIACATFQRCRRHIATHFRRLRSLEQIAAECEIDEAYLCRLFRRFDLQAPYQYLLRLKMNFAAEQLRNRNMLVKEVAASVGFTDPFHFSHAFKNVFGASPEIFRLQEQS
ncbi:MAG TPA: AraC family transcriptional regulator [Humisphaera sp.]|jgi:AraC-like DNA-binding protein|nr:AraC family transcriptional regulator [Humisphaera sp.]